MGHIWLHIKFFQFTGLEASFEQNANTDHFLQNGPIMLSIKVISSIFCKVGDIIVILVGAHFSLQ